MFVKLSRLPQSRRVVLPKYRISRKFQFPLGRRWIAVRYKKDSSIPVGLDRDFNMAAVSLFGDSNMAAVTSCENQEFLVGSYSRLIFHVATVKCNVL